MRWLVVLILCSPFVYAEELKLISPQMNSEVVCSRAVFKYLSDVKAHSPSDYDSIMKRLGNNSRMPCETASYLGIDLSGNTQAFQPVKSNGLNQMVIQKYNEELKEHK